MQARVHNPGRLSPNVNPKEGDPCWVVGPGYNRPGVVGQLTCTSQAGGFYCKQWECKTTSSHVSPGGPLLPGRLPPATLRAPGRAPQWGPGGGQSMVSGSVQSVSQRGQTTRGGCPGQIRCADGRCVDSVLECDLRVSAGRTPSGQAQVRTAMVANPAHFPHFVYALFGQPVPRRNPRAQNPCTSDQMCAVLHGPGYACRNGDCVYIGSQVSAGGTTRAGCAKSCAEANCTPPDWCSPCYNERGEQEGYECVSGGARLTARPGGLPAPVPPRPTRGIQVRPLGTITARQQARLPPQSQVIGSGPISARLAAFNPYVSDPNPRGGGMRTPGQMWWSPTGWGPWAWRPPSAPAVPWGAWPYYGNIWPWNGVTAPMPNPGFPTPRHVRTRNPVYRQFNPPPDKPIFGQPQPGAALPPQWFYYQSPTTMGAPPFGGPVAAPGPPPGVFGLGGICYSNLDCGENEYCHQGVCLPVIDPTKPQGNPGRPRTQSPFPRRSNPGGMTSQTVPLAPGIPLR